MRFIFAALLALSLAAICQGRLEAAEIVNTLPGYDPNQGATIGFGGFAEAAEFSFVTGSYNLSSITLPLGDLTGGSLVTVELETSSGGLPSGSVLDTMSGLPANSGLPVGVTTTFISSLHPLLTAGTNYWIVVETNPANGVSWQNAAVATGTSATSFDNGSTWSSDPGNSTPFGALAFEVSGTPPGGGTVPEPGALALLGTGLAGFVVFRRRAK